MDRRPWQRIKSREYHSASEKEKVLWACGIPSRFWRMKAGSVVPASFHYELKDGTRERTTAAAQQKYLNERLSHPELLTENRLICITSEPSDEHGMAAACTMARALIASQLKNDKPVKVRIDDIQDYELSVKLNVPFFSVKPEMLLIHNLDENTSKARLSLARDLLLKYEGIYRGVVAACDNPKRFIRDILHLEPQEYYHFEGRPQKVIAR